MRKIFEKSSIVIMLVDVINDLDFPDGPKFKKSFASMSIRLNKLLIEARQNSIPILYVNDNFGRWRSNFTAQISHSTRPEAINHQDVLRLVPEETDYYILKPKHSAFYASPTEILLKELGAKAIVLCGISAENCILFTASDAYLRDFKIILPSDCLASESPLKLKMALSLMKKSHKALITNSKKLRFTSKSLLVESSR